MTDPVAIVKYTLIVLALVLALAAPAAAQSLGTQGRGQRAQGDGQVIAAIAVGVAGVYLLEKADEAGEDLIWPERGRSAARWLSAGTVAGGLVLACADLYSSHIDQAKTCLRREAINVGVAYGLAELAKTLVDRERPDKSDRRSFFSMHTSIACAGAFTSTRELAAAALCGSTAYLRVAAGRHWLTDVLTGAVAGIAVTRIAR